MKLMKSYLLNNRNSENIVILASPPRQGRVPFVNYPSELSSNFPVFPPNLQTIIMPRWNLNGGLIWHPWFGFNLHLAKFKRSHAKIPWPYSILPHNKSFYFYWEKTRMLSLRRVPLTSQSSYCKKQRAWFRIYGEFVQKVNGAADYKRTLYLKKGSSSNSSPSPSHLDKRVE